MNKYLSLLTVVVMLIGDMYFAYIYINSETLEYNDTLKYMIMWSILPLMISVIYLLGIVIFNNARINLIECMVFLGMSDVVSFYAGVAASSDPNSAEHMSVFFVPFVMCIPGLPILTYMLVKLVKKSREMNTVNR
jgi:hypothetical protein